ncbi:cytidylyltransferase [Schizosaccharomyces cryophilus OY26]|uniref:Cytidylyltransferase n=1 Tax=Schizosaccharomyces cryophilus (strain OY26 / ATCC MYA-4695 / CBS 11777 / NBRC 106824 / NRRL Y48691) TaxID=653667 RepID=S9X373_SCHCR|nr:cytidylyltransferase [Schizosaccharomyces cryophilus OY26]EPY51557.1 cytidylyltransferase [Schizosaccharomyces cryophilus OY26]
MGKNTLIAIRVPYLETITKYLSTVSKVAERLSENRNNRLYIWVCSPELKEERNERIFFKLSKALSELYLCSITTKDPSIFNVVPTVVLFEDWSGYSVQEISNLCDTIYCTKNYDGLISKSNTEVLDIEAEVLEGRELEQSFVEIENEEKKISNRIAAVGGTFDHLHVGHKVLLTLSAWIGIVKVYVGVSGNELLLNKIERAYLESIEVRKNSVYDFLHSIKKNIQSEIVTINDPFGPTITTREIDSLLVSEETVKGADAVQMERRKRGLPELDIYCIDILNFARTTMPENSDPIKLSSTAIRKELAKNNF